MILGHCGVAHWISRLGLNRHTIRPFPRVGGIENVGEPTGWKSTLIR